MEKSLSFSGIMDIHSSSIELCTASGSVNLDDAIRGMLGWNNSKRDFSSLPIRLNITADVIDTELIINNEVEEDFCDETLASNC